MIKSIEYIGKEECQCIYVDNEEHLYLTNDFIVTHNTISLITSYLLFVMTTFDQQNAAIAGKSIGTIKRNVITPLKQIAMTLNMEVIEHRSENFLEIKYGDKVNYFYTWRNKDANGKTISTDTYVWTSGDGKTVITMKFVDGKLVDKNFKR